MLEVAHTVRTYRGKPGCMCGCRGTYSETPRARKMAITQMLADPTVKFEVGHIDKDIPGCIFISSNSRVRVLYLNADGIAAVRAMGIPEA